MNEKNILIGDLIPGKIYYQTRKCWSYGYIFIYKSPYYMRTGSPEKYESQREYCAFYNNDQEIREATESEKNWLNACITAGKFVQQLNLDKHYEVY